MVTEADDEPRRGEPVRMAGPSAVAIRSVSVTGLFILLGAIVLHQAAALFVPIVLAIFLTLLLTPIVAALAAGGIPRPWGALVVLTIAALLVSAIASYLKDPALEWAQRAPAAVAEVRAKLAPIREPVEQIGEVAEQVEDLTELTDADRDGGEIRVVTEPGIVSLVMRELPRVATSAVVMLFLTFFLLASGDSLMRKLARLGRTFGERRRLVLIATGIRREVTSYLVTVTLVNAMLGVVVAVVMHAIGVPNALLWGALAMLANYAPYLGPALMVLLLTAVGLITQDTLPSALLVPSAYFVLTLFEGQLVTPLVLGHRLNLSPVVVFVSILVWGYLWGVPGAVVAVPIAAAIRIAASHVERGRALFILLGR